MAYGLQYNPDNPTECFYTIDNMVGATRDLFTLLPSFYNIQNLPEILTYNQGLVTYNAVIYADCNI